MMEFVKENKSPKQHIINNTLLLLYLDVSFTPYPTGLTHSCASYSPKGNLHQRIIVLFFVCLFWNKFLVYIRSEYTCSCTIEE